MTDERARQVLLCSAIGAAAYSALHLYVAWVRNLSININFFLLVALCIVAIVAYAIARYDHHVALVIYCTSFWAVVTAMTIHYANDPRCTGVPGVVSWLALGAVLSGMCGSRQAIIYTLFSALTFLWIVLVYDDPGYALVRFPFIVGAVLVGYIYREYDYLKGQLSQLETALRICNDAPQGRENP